MGVHCGLISWHVIACFFPPSIITSENTGRHARERHTKTKSWFTLLECLIHADKSNNLSTPWAGLNSCLPRRQTREYELHLLLWYFSLTVLFPLSSSKHFAVESSVKRFSFLNYLTFLGWLLYLYLITVTCILGSPFSTVVRFLNLRWLSTKYILVSQWLMTVQMWGKIKSKLADALS